MKTKLFTLFILITHAVLLISAELNIGVTGNNRGLLTPCGCKIPSGGWARIATVQDQMEQPLLMVGAGNHFFHHTPIPKENQIFEQKEAVLQARFFSELNYNVINAGQFDLCYGLKVLQSLQSAYDLPIISANIRDTQGKLAFQPYKIINIEGLDIMFVGICQLEDGFNFRIDDPLKALIKLYEDGAYEKADLVILLADAYSGLLSNFVKEFEGIDVIIAAKEHTFTNLPITYQKSSLIQMGSQGKYCGILNVHFSDEESEWQDISPLQFRINSLRASLKAVTKDKQAYHRKIRRAKKQHKRFVKENPNFYSLDMIFLDDSIKDDPEITKQIEEFLNP